jgi:hypothetical protein
MRKRFRLVMWSSVILTIVFQIAFLLELNSAVADDETMWCMFGLSVACFGMFLYARTSLLSLRKRYQRPLRWPDPANS